VNVRGATTRTWRLASCEGKSAFRSHAAAAADAKRIAQRSEKRLQVYHCRHCHHFHIGNSIERGAEFRRMPDKRKRFGVFARNAHGVESLVGWSDDADGGKVAEMISEAEGWTLSRVSARRKKAA